MRTILPGLLVILAVVGPAHARAAMPAGRPGPADLSALERAWHGCVREVYAQQPAGQGRAASQRGALDACRAHEDRYVAALMAARSEDDRPLGARARAWVATVAASLVDPVAAWIGALQR